ncbi:hypothetical protein Vwe01_24780 [Micromonospora andamanensis]|nr:hypothetical protein Vwe01_24780 [Micromonospora andamanensis]
MSRSATSHDVAVTFGGVGAEGGTINPGVASRSPPTTRCSGTDGGGVGFGDRTTFGATAFGQGAAVGIGAAEPGSGGGVPAGAGRAAQTDEPAPTVIAATPGVAGMVTAARAAQPAARARILMNTQTNGRILAVAHPVGPVPAGPWPAIFAGKS